MDPPVDLDWTETCLHTLISKVPLTFWVSYRQLFVWQLFETVGQQSESGLLVVALSFVHWLITLTLSEGLNRSAVWSQWQTVIERNNTIFGNCLNWSSFWTDSHSIICLIQMFYGLSVFTFWRWKQCSLAVIFHEANRCHVEYTSGLSVNLYHMPFLCSPQRPIFHVEYTSGLSVNLCHMFLFSPQRPIFMLHEVNRLDLIIWGIAYNNNT